MASESSQNTSNTFKITDTNPSNNTITVTMDNTDFSNLEQNQWIVESDLTANDINSGYTTGANWYLEGPQTKAFMETGPHPFLDDMEVWVAQGKKYAHYTFSHICPDMELPGESVPYIGKNIKPALAILAKKCVCIECGEEFPEYAKLVTMWKMKSIGDARKSE